MGQEVQPHGSEDVGCFEWALGIWGHGFDVDGKRVSGIERPPRSPK